ncbi:MAG: class I SAM-dependent methyltransferase, partial [Pseudomonadota bacterium]
MPSFVARTLYTACPLCNTGDIRPLLTADCSGHALFHPAIPPQMTWLKCAACQHVFTDGYYTEDALELLFGQTHENQRIGFDMDNQRAISARMVEKVLPYAQTGNWLDVGFGNGSLLMTAAEYGFVPVGIDLRRPNVEGMKRFGIEAHCVDIGELNQPARFSVVSLADVLEHMPFPRESLEIVHRLLRSGGILFLSMPNMDSVLWRSLDESQANPYWGELEHYHNFGRKRLFELLHVCGFEPVRFGIGERYRVCMEVLARKEGETAYGHSGNLDPRTRPRQRAAMSGDSAPAPAQ